MTQAPASTTTAWLFDLSDTRGPRFVVLRADEDDARDLLARYLVELAGVAESTDVRELLAHVTPESVVVLR